MKHTLISAAAALLMSACGLDPEPTAATLATQRLNELYADKVVGEWSGDTLRGGDMLISEYFKLDADKQGKYVFTVKSRDGEGALCGPDADGWYTLYADSAVGRWRLNVDDLMNKWLSVSDTTSGSRVFSFSSADDNELHVGGTYIKKLEKVTHN